MAKLFRSVENVVKGYSLAEVKVREATSNDPWGPTGTSMAEIAQLTFDKAATFYQIVDMLLKRLNSKSWRHIHKALKVLDYLLHEGSDLVVTWARKNTHIIQNLREFRHVDSDGRDVGANVRIAAKDIYDLLMHEGRLQAERKDRKTWKSRVTGIEVDRLPQGGSSSNIKVSAVPEGTPKISATAEALQAHSRFKRATDPILEQDHQPHGYPAEPENSLPAYGRLTKDNIESSPHRYDIDLSTVPQTHESKFGIPTIGTEEQRLSAPSPMYENLLIPSKRVTRESSPSAPSDISPGYVAEDDMSKARDTWRQNVGVWRESLAGDTDVTTQDDHIVNYQNSELREQFRLKGSLPLHSAMPPPTPALPTWATKQVSFISADDQQEYEDAFFTAMGSLAVRMPWIKVAEILRNELKVSDNVIHKIGELCNTSLSGHLHFVEFALAMYFAVRSRIGKPLPASLPLRLKDEVGRHLARSMSRSAGTGSETLASQAELESQDLKRTSPPLREYQASQNIGTQINQSGSDLGRSTPLSPSISASSATLSPTIIETSPVDSSMQQSLTTRLNAYFPEGEDRKGAYTDADIHEIAMLLKYSNPRWSKVPRTYIVLRTIGSLDSLDHCVDVGFSDYWFPVTERNLPESLRPSVRAAFVDAQGLVMTKSLGLEKGDRGQHCYFRKGETLPLEMKGILGSGGYGQVDKVLSLISFKHYARKRVLRSAAFRGRKKEEVKQFVSEIEILKRLKHHHIVEFIGSYTDAKYIGLLMLPVADMDLATYMKNSSTADSSQSQSQSQSELRTFFGCLATGLEFLHEHNVRHKDIKPGNILVSNGNVLFTDFGLSLDFTDATGSTTMSMVNGMTPRYCAPEVAKQEARNTMSDIWCLGVVFLEMVVTLKGQPIRYIDDFFKQKGSDHFYVRLNIDLVPELLAHIGSSGQTSANKALEWIREMLLEEQKARPTASTLVTWITTPIREGESTGFCGICCALTEEEDFSDYSNE